MNLELAAPGTKRRAPGTERAAAVTGVAATALGTQDLGRVFVHKDIVRAGDLVRTRHDVIGRSRLQLCRIVLLPDPAHHQSPGTATEGCRPGGTGSGDSRVMG